MVHLLNPIPPTVVTFRAADARTSEEPRPAQYRRHGATSETHPAETGHITKIADPAEAHKDSLELRFGTPTNVITPRRTPRTPRPINSNQVTPRRDVVEFLPSEDAPISSELPVEEEIKEIGFPQNTDFTGDVPRNARHRKQADSQFHFEPKETIFDYARKGESEKVRELLRNKKLSAKEAGNRELLSEALNESDERGWTALHWSAEGDESSSGRIMAEKRREVMRVLLGYRDEGLDLNARSSSNNTPLSHAVRCRNLEGCRLLLKKGADPNAVTEYGWTALHWAANGHRAPRAITCAQHFSPMPDMLQLLLRRTYGANVAAASRSGDTPLHVACARGFGPVAELLIQSGARADATNAMGETPLHTTVGAGHDALIPTLLAAGARPLALDRQQRTPAQSHAAGTVRALAQMVRPENTGRDSDEERALSDAALTAWLGARGLDARRLLAPAPNPWDILQLTADPDIAGRLRAGNDRLDDTDMELLEARADALRTLCGEVASAGGGEHAVAAAI